jgi:hypothetical protein
MLRFLRMLFPCRCEWEHVFNASRPVLERMTTFWSEFGVYQCRKCKTLSIGVKQDFPMMPTDAALAVHERGGPGARGRAGNLR